MSLRVTIDDKEVDKLKKDLAKLTKRQIFLKRDVRSITSAGARIMVQPARVAAKKRPKSARILVFSPRGRGPVFAHKPGNLAKTLTTLNFLKKAYGSFVGAKMRNPTPGGTHTTAAGKKIPLFGTRIKTSYAPYAYKAYGNKSGSNFGTELLQPLIARHGRRAQELMIARALTVLNKKLQKHVIK